MAWLHKVFPLIVPHPRVSSSSRSCHKTSWEGRCASTTGGLFSRSVCCFRDPEFSEVHHSSGSLSYRKTVVDKLWWEFFSDPSQWWDHRLEKVNPRYPDFKHKKTRKSLWLDHKLTPPWVEAELAAMPPGTLQSHNFSWHVRLRRHVKEGDYKKTLDLFEQMQREGVILDKFIFVPVLNACSNLRYLREGKRVHEQIIQSECESDIYVANGLVDMYAKCGSIEDAWNVFNNMQIQDMVSWNAIIGAYVKSGQGLKAMELFQDMQEKGVVPSTVTFVGVLNACASVAALEEGRRVHEQIIRSDCESNVYVATCLVDMYAKCGNIEDASRVFNKMREYDMVSWNAMIGGYVKSGQGLNAIELFRKMQQEEVEPDAVTFVGVLSACASVAALQEGRRVHGQIIHRGCESDVFVAAGLVDMYAKCGSIEDARSVFEKMQERDVVSWNAMIGGYAMHGLAKKSIALFRRMGKEGIEIDWITFTCILSACSHSGLVKEGLRYFNSMVSSYNMAPKMEHYACMVDLLGRAGRLEDAEEMMKTMHVERHVDVWMSLLAACRIHGNVKMAERAAKRCWELGYENASGHVLLSNIYAAAGKWDWTAATGEERLQRYRTWIEVNNLMHSFVTNEKEHPKVLEIFAELARLSMQMNEAGYVSDM